MFYILLYHTKKLTELKKKDCEESILRNCNSEYLQKIVIENYPAYPSKIMEFFNFFLFLFKIFR